MSCARLETQPPTPVGAYYTWHDNNLEGRGVAPDVEERVSPHALWKGEDNQLKRALECVTGKAAIAVQ
jgi:C-terminal processing protease CtpA/Prc